MTVLSLHFEKPADWADTIHVHYWSDAPGGAASDWPGVPMSPAHRPGWFSFRLTGSGATYLLFHDNQGHQTPDLYRTQDGWYSGGRALARRGTHGGRGARGRTPTRSQAPPTEAQQPPPHPA